MADKGTSSPIVAETNETATVPSSQPKKAGAESPDLSTKRVQPRTADMVVAAIEALNEHGGSSLQAIKKYIASTYKIDIEKKGTFIRKYLKIAVSSGVLIQTKGKGAAGSFKLPKTKTAKPIVKLAPKPKSPKKAKVALKKSASPKKTAASGKKSPAKKTATIAASEKKKVPTGPAAKPPKAKTAKAKPPAKSPAKVSKPVATKKSKAVAPKAKKAAATKK